MPLLAFEAGAVVLCCVVCVVWGMGGKGWVLFRVGWRGGHAAGAYIQQTHSMYTTIRVLQSHNQTKSKPKKHHPLP